MAQFLNRKFYSDGFSLKATFTLPYADNYNLFLRKASNNPPTCVLPYAVPSCCCLEILNKQMKVYNMRNGRRPFIVGGSHRRLSDQSLRWPLAEGRRRWMTLCGLECLNESSHYLVLVFPRRRCSSRGVGVRGFRGEWERRIK